MSDIKKRGCVFELEYHMPNCENRGYFSGRTKYNFFNYISRNENIDKHTPIEKTSSITDPDTNAKIIPEKEKFNIHNKDGCVMNKDQICAIQKKLQASDSVFWTGILSFKGEEEVFNIQKEQEAIMLMKKNFLISSPLVDEKNIDYVYSFHNDTDNNHIHVMFFEKEPKHLDSNGNTSYTIKGKLPITTIKNVQKNIDNDLLGRYKEIYPLRNALTSKAKTLTDEYPFSKEVELLATYLPPTGSLAYDNANMLKLKPKVDNITNKILEYGENKPIFNDIIKLSKFRQDELSYTNHIDPNYQQNFIEDIYRRIGNIVISHAKNIKVENYKYNNIQCGLKKNNVKNAIAHNRKTHKCRLKRTMVNLTDNTMREIMAFRHWLDEKQNVLDMQDRATEKWLEEMKNNNK